MFNKDWKVIKMTNFNAISFEFPFFLYRVPPTTYFNTSLRMFVCFFHGKFYIIMVSAYFQCMSFAIRTSVTRLWNTIFFIDFIFLAYKFRSFFFYIHFPFWAYLIRNVFHFASSFDWIVSCWFSQALWCNSNYVSA